MKFWTLLFTFFTLIFTSNHVLAQDTFSIVAVDPETGEVGSAGASCIDDLIFPGSGGVAVISRLYPGRGAINTQALWNAVNQDNAGQQLLSGKSPEEVRNWLLSNDAQDNRFVRQYGIVDLDENNQPRSAAYTGTFTTAYKGHILGENYAIQGNILLGPEILDSMEARFIRSEGKPLAERLMESLQGGNVPGADTRCLDEGVSSLSAYIQVAKREDTQGDFHLDINIPFTDTGVEPIDILQEAFNEWLNPTNTPELELVEETIVHIHPNPVTQETVFEIENPNHLASYTVQIFDSSGKQVQNFQYDETDTQLKVKELSGKSGVYLYHVWQRNRLMASGEFVVID